MKIRFFGRLNDFLPGRRRFRYFSYVVKGSPSIKDTIEAIGIPHTAVDLILCGQKALPWFYQLKEDITIRVYPQGYKLKCSHPHLLPPYPKRKRFILDVHLGKLARLLRLCGFDARYSNTFSDRDIVQQAVNEKRIVLTRDIGLLKHKSLQWGYWVRATNAVDQMREVVKYFQLGKAPQPFSRCLECNARIYPVNTSKVKSLVPWGVRQEQRKFYRCWGCGRIYWPGTHYQELNSKLKRIFGKT